MQFTTAQTLALALALAGSAAAAPTEQKPNFDNPLVNRNGTTKLLGYIRGSDHDAPKINKMGTITDLHASQAELGSGWGAYMLQKPPQVAAEDFDINNWLCVIWADTKAFQTAPKVSASQNPDTVLDQCMARLQLNPAATVRMGVESEMGGVATLNVPVELLNDGFLKIGAQCARLEEGEDLDQYPAAQYDHLKNFVDCNKTA
ncbi:uncharacterized protein K452DRAFT_357784 [Aplosporella prunicola CBS 121167]|uniref:Uncharacterized protein n=1 Tax=Aplosporella prunicola CBS 121167 TaxID=1176127 RepID=A0A6A6BJI1_9PEZI|nr:uncharacterized protein K452DRAFT_357784 [Aplosporella prunicola CBS 121167]KAF2143485.1 hypothetical protein K452DRAFT_357784 [Aplosporella prunicola CBS 121167]